MQLKGLSMGGNEDCCVFILFQIGKCYYGSSCINYNFMIVVNDVNQIDIGMDYVIVVFCNVCGFEVVQDNDFEIIKSDSFIGLIWENIMYFCWVVVGIGLIIFIGVVIGLMNIMLVLVMECIWEIGIFKVIGVK